MRLQTAPRELLAPRSQRVWIAPAVRAAAGTGLAAAVCVLLLLSPFFTVRTVRWSGVVQPLQPRLEEVETAVRGKPLMLLSQSKLEDLLQVDSRKLRLRFERHLPGTLEVIVSPRFAVWALAGSQVFDARGRRLDPSQHVPGLKELKGFTLVGDAPQLRDEDRQILSRLLELERQTGLELAAVTSQGDALVLKLSPSRQQVWLSRQQFEPGLHKLRMLARRLDVDRFPAHVDLRFRDQIVLAAKNREGRHGRP